MYENSYAIGISSNIFTIGFIVTIFVILAYGLLFVTGTILALLAFFLGASYRLYNKVLHEPRDVVERRKVQILHQVPVEKEDVQNNRSKMDMRLTGSAIIDETMHEMIDYIMRDYVHSWYDYISEDDEFVHQLRKTMQETLVVLSSRVKEIDWIPFLTTQLVDDAATHLRLYRSALAKTKENPQSDLISVFFDFEAAMEKNLCRDMVCTDDTHLQDYLQGLGEALLYLLLPPDTYNCTPVGTLAQDLLVNYVFVPILQIFSDPDVVNQHIIWLCQSFPVTPDVLLTTIRMCDHIDEISAVHYFFTQQVADTKDALDITKSPDEKAAYRDQYKGLTIIKKIIDQKLSRLKEGNPGDWTDDGDQWQNYFLTPGMKLHCLALEEILKNSVALSYFIDYMNSVNGNHYILLYLNADAWKSSAEQQLSMIESAGSKNAKLSIEQSEINQTIFQCIKDAAVNVYDQFLGEKASPRVKLPENVVKRFYIQIRTEPVLSLTVFDEVQEALIDLMQTTEKFYPSFLRHKLYVKCLIEIDLLKAESVNANASDDEEDEEEVSVEVYEDIETISRRGDSPGSSLTSLDSVFDVACKDDYQMCRDCLKQRKIKAGSFTPQEELNWEKNLLLKRYKLNAEIIEAGLASEKGKQYGVYAVQVTRVDGNDRKEKVWHLYRRYSDFYDFHQWIKAKWNMMNRIEFPGKHTFRTTERMFLEKRKTALNKYLCSVLTMTVDPCFGESIQDTLLHFLEPGIYVVKKKQLSEKIDTLVNPLKQSVRSVTDVVKSVPDTFINTVDGFTRIFHSKTPVTASFIEANKVGASIDEADDNIPLRIILLLMDEVFDLKSRNQWLRRRIVAIIRQVLKAMLGDTINRRIVDYVAYLTSPVRVSGYLKSLQQALWPGGGQISFKPSRDTETKMRTRFAAKFSLLASLSDELKHLIGSETTRRGLLCVFDLCQDPVLNRRFILVLFEGILKTLFPDKPFLAVIQRLHYRSNRVSRHRPFLVTPGTPSSISALTRSASSASTTGIGSVPNVSPRSSRKKK